ncbi:peptidyl-prolyl cis-trans isomerase C [archaeon BMS3Abin16]|nr:peptidyl-prolyl cis-trans isomerase C [archaeon BMS3Abin16]GBE56771.1 peptidyl-prolyl cis-trans isomerase C [archaeon BMS3Bbin16]HDY73868.1 peptidylprolyl isomerase [Euryarchaeota archaeon]
MSKIRASHILCKTQPEANEVIEMLNSGESFEQLAKERSLCPSGKRGGDLGSFSRGMMVKEFEQATYNLKSGETTMAPVKTQFGWHIIKRTG